MKISKRKAAEGGKKSTSLRMRSTANEAPSGFSRAVERSLQIPLFHDIGKYDKQFADYLKTGLSLYWR
jgi:hypothetical protein